MPTTKPEVLAHVEKIWKEQLTDQPPQTAKQIAAAKAMIELFLNAFEYHDYDAVRSMCSKDYIQHNVTLGTGSESIIEFAKRECTDPATNVMFDYQRILVDGDYIVAHIHAMRRDGAEDLRLVEIFRYQNGLFTEHWDTAAPVPPKSEHKNDNGCF